MYVIILAVINCVLVRFFYSCCMNHGMDSVDLSSKVIDYLPLVSSKRQRNSKIMVNISSVCNLWLMNKTQRGKISAE